MRIYDQFGFKMAGLEDYVDPETWLGGGHFDPKTVQNSSFVDLVFEKCRRGGRLNRSELFQSAQKKCLR